VHSDQQVVNNEVSLWLRERSASAPVPNARRVEGLWFMVYGLWFMVYGLWFMVYGLSFRVHGLGFGV